jgi:hypothetical protein
VFQILPRRNCASIARLKSDYFFEELCGAIEIVVCFAARARK